MGALSGEAERGLGVEIVARSPWAVLDRALMARRRTPTCVHDAVTAGECDACYFDRIADLW